MPYLLAMIQVRPHEGCKYCNYPTTLPNLTMPQLALHLFLVIFTNTL